MVDDKNFELLLLNEMDEDDDDVELLPLLPLVGVVVEETIVEEET